MEDSEAKELSKKILSIQEEERHRISRDLHDEIGQFSVSLGSALNIIEKEISKRNLDTALRVIKDAKAILANTTEKIRTLFIDLRPAELGMLGLPSVLRELFSHYTKTYPLNIKFRENLVGITIKDDMAIALYRIIQEAFNNIVKHARAKTVKIDLLLKAGEINLSIEDDGIGFDHTPTDERRKRVDSKLGLFGMQRRAQQAGGSIAIESSEGAGTELRAVFSW